MMKHGLTALMALVGIGGVPTQDGVPLAATAVDATLSALMDRVDDLEDRVSAIEARCQCGLESAPVASVAVPAGIDPQVYAQAVASLAPGETLVAINGIPVNYTKPAAAAPAVNYSQPVSQPVRQAAPARTYRQPVRRGILRGGWGRPSTCGPNGCY